jgi:hypothetical protein
MKINTSSLKTEWILPRILISTVIFYFLKTAFWPLTFLFIATYATTLLLLLFKIDKNFNFLQFVDDFKLPLLLAGIFVMEYLVRRQFSIKIVQKDILLILVLFSFFYFLHWKRALLIGESARSFLLNLIIITISLISILNLFYQFFHQILPTGLLLKINISEGFSIANDYNFFCLFLIFGLLIINNEDKNDFLYYHLPKTQIAFLSLLFVFNIIISGSRRAIFVLIVLLILKAISGVFNAEKSKSLWKYLKRIIRIVFIGILFLTILVFALQYMPKQNLKNLAAKYSSLTGKNEISLTEKYLWRRESTLPLDKKYLIDKSSIEGKEKFWKCISAPGTSILYLDTKYGKSIKVTRTGGGNDGYSLQYVGPEILYYANHSYRISYKIKFLEGDFNSFNVGWWANDGKRGFAYSAALVKKTIPIDDGWYSCISDYTFIDNQFGITGFFNSVSDRTSFIISDFELIDLNFNSSLPRYVFEIKETGNIMEWLNKSNITYSGNNLINNGRFENGKNFWRCTSDSSINIKIENVQNVKCAFISREAGNGGDWSLFNIGRPVDYIAGNEYEIAFKVMPVKPKTIPFKVGFWVDEGEGFQNNLKLKIDTLKDGWLEAKTSYKFKNNHNDLLFLINSQVSNSQFYITDISLINLTQTQYQTDISSDKSDRVSQETFFLDRSSRWIYARELWETKFNVRDKIFGHGFDYLEWYGEKFLGSSKKYDWPHNPLISIVLYSGVAGLLFYILLITRAVVLYLNYRNKHKLAFIGFLITLFFSFFSAGNPFDPPIMGFFILLPFFIHSIYKNVNKTEQKTNYI